MLFRSQYTTKYTVTCTDANGNTVTSPLNVTFTIKHGNETKVINGETEYLDFDADKVVEIAVVVAFPNGTAANDNPYQGCSVKIDFTVDIVQANGVDANGDLILP